VKHLLFLEYSFPSHTPFLRYKFQTLSKVFDITFASRQGRSGKKEYLSKFGNANLISLENPWLRPLEFLPVFILFLISKPQKMIKFYRFCVREKGKKHGLKWFLQCFPLLQKNWSLIHFEFGTIAHELIFIAEFFKAKAVTSFRGYDIAYVGLQNENYYKEVWEKSTMVHFLGNDLLSKGIQRGFSNRGNYFLASPAIFIEEFPWQKRQLPELSPIHLVSVGRLTWKKGYMIGLMAIKKLVEQGVLLRYHLVGSGEEEQAIRFHIHDLELEDVVILHGKKSPKEVAQILSEAHLFFHPAISEGFCNAVVEAQSVGLPVVCSDAEGLSENIENGVTGFIFQRRNADQAAEKLLQLINNPALYHSMNLAGPIRVSKYFNIQQQVATFSDVYRKMLA
jgi:colanic acid/amylovoran biosynthesis glycosyltransferase